jgi:hypothetical protein
VVRVLSVALCAALSLSVALVAGFLSRLTGAHPAAAVLRGGAAFAGAFGVLVLALDNMGVL